MKGLVWDNRKQPSLAVNYSATQVEVCATFQKFQDSNPAIKQDGRSITVESKEGQRLENNKHVKEAHVS